MPDSSMGKSFYQQVVDATPGGDVLATCLQCGTCGGSCPSGADMDATPRKLFAMIAANMEDEVLSSNTFWYCVSCYYCTVRCPQEIPITDLMYTLKRIAVLKGHYHKDSHVPFSSSFIGFVEQYGRSFEFGLVTRHHLAHAPLKQLGKSTLGLQMMQKGRLTLTPERIKTLPQLSAILSEAKRVSAQQEV
nr:4Fe-4S dicluster domain-containing protein [Anaerolineae bacterium]